MTRLTAKDFDPKLLELYDFYAHGKITKREFLDGATKFAVAGMTALLHKSRHEDSLYESSVIAGGYEQLDTYEV
jgi:hypothetical protein